MHALLFSILRSHSTLCGICTWAGITILLITVPINCLQVSSQGYYLILPRRQTVRDISGGVAKERRKGGSFPGNLTGLITLLPGNTAQKRVRMCLRKSKYKTLIEDLFT